MEPVDLVLAKHRVDAVEVLEHWASLIEENRIKEIKKLLDSGELNITEPIINGLTPLHVACIQGNAEAVRLLIKSGADINARSKVGRTPLLEAAFYGHSACVDLLIRAGADLGVLNESAIRTVTPH